MFKAGGDKAAALVQQQGVKRVRGWLEDALPDNEKDEEDGGSAPSGEETNVIVNQLACKEPGCPDVECVLTLIRAKPRPKLMFKIYKAAAELSQDEVNAALQKALTEESGAHDHDHAEAADGHAGHAADCDCCDEHGHDEHGHDEAEHGHDEADKKKLGVGD